MVRARLRKRPPPPSELEDKSAEMLLLPVDTEAELQSDDPGFLGSFYEVTITGHLVSSGLYRVVYSTLVDEDGEPLVETVAAANVRPRPPFSARTGFAVHEAVEARHNDGWWSGVVSAVPRPRVYQVVLPMSRETMEFEEKELRRQRVFQAGRWVPAAEVVLDDGSPLFREGTQVEVSRSAKRFGESWTPAYVRKVIGATNFLVEYIHIGTDGELATEILDSQYIRPVHTYSKCRFSPRSSCVEVMHKDSWWPCVIQDVLGSGIDRKYLVKLKSYETDKDDMECVDGLTVEDTQLRPRFHWNGKSWLRCLEEKSATLASRKRPISSALSLHKEVGESSGEHGSYREKKLKTADVVSEPIHPLSPVCNENHEIKHKSSSYAGETVKQGNTVLAPPSLPQMAGFARLSASSLAQSSHLGQESSLKITIPSERAAPERRQSQVYLFGSFGQSRTLTEGPFSGKKSLTPDFGSLAAAGSGTEHSKKTEECDGSAMVECTAERNLLTEKPATTRPLSSDGMTCTTESEPADSLTNIKGADDDQLSESLAI